jgi:ribosomal protein L14E/L6E/L27E
VLVFSSILHFASQCQRNGPNEVTVTERKRINVSHKYEISKLKKEEAVFQLTKKTNAERRKLKSLSRTDEFSMKVERMRTGDERWI